MATELGTTLVASEARNVPAHWLVIQAAFYHS